MELSCGYMKIDTQKLYSKKKILSYNGQICVDGVETFIVKNDIYGVPRRYYCYSKREEVFEKVKDFFGDNLDEEIDKLVIQKAVSVKEIKVTLASQRKADRVKVK